MEITGCSSASSISGSWIAEGETLGERLADGEMDAEGPPALLDWDGTAWFTAPMDEN